jgi:hypothetical protein
VAISKSAANDTGLQFKLGDNWGPTEKLDVLRDLVAAQESLFGEKVEQGLLGKAKKEPVQKSLDDCREHVQKYLAKHGFTLNELLGKPAELADAAPVTLEDA